jgi:superfamily II DNA or RNA helicase
MSDDRLTLLRSGNWLTVTPCPPRVRGVLARLLTFVERKFKRGREARLAARRSLPLWEETAVECFIDDHKGRVSFPYGFVEEAVAALTEKGYEVAIDNLTPPRDPSVYEPDWECVFDDGVELRHKQDEFLVKVAVHENGRFSCPTGFGKSFLIGRIARMWPFARIAVVSDSVTVIRDVIYPDLCQTVPDVGIVGGGCRRRGRRVTCYTADSLHWLLKDSEEYGDYDAVVFDECHLAAADNCSYMLAQIPGQPRMFGFSASQDMRADGKDYRVHALFGPLRLDVEYQEAERHGLIVPMQVRVHKVVMDVSPCSGLTGEDKMRAGVWANDFRNDQIIHDAVRYAAKDMQTMISCQVLEHVLNLKKRFDRLKRKGRVPEHVELVCLYREHGGRADWHETLRDMSRERKDVGAVFEGLPYMDLERRIRLTKDIERGKIKLFAGTTVLNVGFDPKDMRVVCRADCTSSKIADTQVPGRNARHAVGKAHGIVLDYWDKFDRGLSGKYRRREQSYRRLKWEVKLVGRKCSPLKKKMHWE